jgi:uncharacterized membrane protein
MWMFYVLIGWMLGWMLLAGLGFWAFAHDKFPYPFLLFLSNLVQLWALPVLGVATNRADVKRQAKADADHEALTSLHHAVDAVLESLNNPGKVDTLAHQIRIDGGL